jgi:hypothetical protein
MSFAFHEHTECLFRTFKIQIQLSGELFMVGMVQFRIGRLGRLSMRTIVAKEPKSHKVHETAHNAQLISRAHIALYCLA